MRPTYITRSAFCEQFGVVPPIEADGVWLCAPDGSAAEFFIFIEEKPAEALWLNADNPQCGWYFPEKVVRDLRELEKIFSL